MFSIKCLESIRRQFYNFFIFLEFDPEPTPKWKCLTSLLTKEIPDDVRKKKDGTLNNTKILILCQDNRTCSQLNHYLTMGANKYLFYTAFRRDLTINAVSSKYSNLKDTIPIEKDKGKNIKDKKPDDSNETEYSDTKILEDNADDDFGLDEANKSNYVLTLTQVVTQSKSKKARKEEQDDSLFEPLSQVNEKITT